MGSVNVFSIRDLRNHSSRLLKDAEEGHLSLITKRGKPAILAVPFEEYTLRLGVEKDLALQLFRTGAITLAKAAVIAGIPVDEFMELLAFFDVPVVDYPVEELENEVEL